MRNLAIRNSLLGGSMSDPHILLQYLDTQPGQFVDTGVRDWTMYDITGKFMSNTNPKTSTHASAFCGSRLTAADYYFGFLISEIDNSMRIHRMLNEYTGFLREDLDDPTKIAECKSALRYSELIYDGEFLGSAYSGANFTCQYNIYLFGINNAMSWSNLASIRFFDLVVKDGANEKYHYRPAIKDGVCCIWESVANVYLYNGGIGNFIPGPAVSDVSQLGGGV